MSIRKALGTISIFLLGMFCNTEPNALAKQLTCQEVAGRGLTPSKPTAVSYLQDGVYSLDVFIRGGDNHIYWNQATHTGFSGWSQVPGDGATDSEPAAVYFNNLLRLFVRGTDYHIYENDYNGTSWSGWFTIGVGNWQTLSGPAVFEANGDRIVLVRGLDNQIYQTNGSSNGWLHIPGGSTISEPTGIYKSGEPSWHAFIRGGDNRIFQSQGSVWSGWLEVPGGGLTLAGPSVLVDGNILKLFATSLNDATFENDYNGTSWSGWFQVSDYALTPSGPAAVEAFGNTPTIFVR